MISLEVPLVISCPFTSRHSIRPNSNYRKEILSFIDNNQKNSQKSVSMILGSTEIK